MAGYYVVVYIATELPAIGVGALTVASGPDGLHDAVPRPTLASLRDDLDWGRETVKLAAFCASGIARLGTERLQGGST